MYGVHPGQADKNWTTIRCFEITSKLFGILVENTFSELHPICWRNWSKGTLCHTFQHFITIFLPTSHQNPFIVLFDTPASWKIMLHNPLPSITRLCAFFYSALVFHSSHPLLFHSSVHFVPASFALCNVPLSYSTYTFRGMLCFPQSLSNLSFV